MIRRCPACGALPRGVGGSAGKHRRDCPEDDSLRRILAAAADLERHMDRVYALATGTTPIAPQTPEEP